MTSSSSPNVNLGIGQDLDREGSCLEHGGTVSPGREATGKRRGILEPLQEWWAGFSLSPTPTPPFPVRGQSIVTSLRLEEKLESWSPYSSFRQEVPADERLLSNKWKENKNTQLQSSLFSVWSGKVHRTCH